MKMTTRFLLSFLIAGGLLCGAMTLTGCAGHTPAPQSHDITLAKDAAAAIDALGVIAKGIESLADSKTITVAQGHQALDIIKAAVKTIRATNSGVYATLSTALEQLGALPFAAAYKSYLDDGRLALAGLEALRGSVTIDETAIVGLVQTFLPSIIGLFAARRRDDLPDPTLEELQAHVAAEASTVLAGIENWEAKNPVRNDG